jgi:transposase-like protein
MITKSRRHRTVEARLQITEEGRQALQTASEACRRHGIAPGQT